MASEKTDRARVRAVYRGRVQGVGFRFTTLDISRPYDVVGHVRNMPDGSVELEAEGERETVDTFLAKIASTMASNIRDEQRMPLAIVGAGGEHSFDIRL